MTESRWETLPAGRRSELPKVLIVYDSCTGNTERAAELIAEGARSRNSSVEVKSVEETKANDIKSSKGIALGCPTHFFSASRRMKNFLEREKVSNALEGKAGAVFASYFLMPMAVNWLLDRMKECGMEELRYTASRGSPKNQEAEDCRHLGERLVESTKE